MPKPILIGFNLEVEKDFFQYFISVEDIGPMKAVKALNVPVREIADAIESGNIQQLTQLNKLEKFVSGKNAGTILMLPHWEQR